MRVSDNRTTKKTVKNKKNIIYEHNLMSTVKKKQQN